MDQFESRQGWSSEDRSKLPLMQVSRMGEPGEKWSGSDAYGRRTSFTEVSNTRLSLMYST